MCFVDDITILAMQRTSEPEEHLHEQLSETKKNIAELEQQANIIIKALELKGQQNITGANTSGKAAVPVNTSETKSGQGVNTTIDVTIPLLQVKRVPKLMSCSEIPYTFTKRRIDNMEENSHMRANIYNLDEHLSADFCFEFWLGKETCNKGIKCAHRHCPPCKEERIFLYTIGATKFLYNMYKNWVLKYQGKDMGKFPFTFLRPGDPRTPANSLPWEVLEYNSEIVESWPRLERINNVWDDLWQRQCVAQQMQMAPREDSTSLGREGICEHRAQKY